MRRLFTIILLAQLCVLQLPAQTFTFSSEGSQTIDGVTVSFAKGSGNNAPAYYAANGLRLYANNTITVSGPSLTEISLVFAKQGTKAYAELSAAPGTLVSGGTSTGENDLKTDSWTGNSTSVTFTVGGSGQRLIKQITIGEGGVVIPGDTTVVTPGDTTTTTPTELDPSYVYGEPTRLVSPRDSFSNRAYSFVQNNIRVEVSTGAQRSDYFGVNAGHTITLTATRPIKGISAFAFLKKDFDADLSSGELYMVDTSDTITANPAIVVTDVDATSLTISCLKQVRFYSLDVYFNENPDTDLPIESDYDFSFEPQEKSEFSMTFDSVFYQDDSANLGYPCAYLYFEGVQHMMDLAVFCSGDAATGIPAGTYAIDATYQPNTVMASPGGDESYDYPSCIYTEFDGEGYYNAAYYLDHGTLTVEAIEGGARYRLDAYTHFGSHATAVWEGRVQNASDDDTAVEIVPSRPTAEKMLKNGHVVIMRFGMKFSADGRRLQ